MTILGRLLARDGSSLRLADATGSVTVDGSGPDAPPGAWLEARGRLAGGVVVDATWTVVAEPTEAFPRADGDWARLHDGARLANLALRSRALSAIRAFLAERDYLEVESPAAVPSPGLDLHLSAFGVEGFGRPRWLMTSPEYQLKRLLSAGLPRIYRLGPVWRAEERGDLHEPEFTMLEWYRTGIDAERLREETEALVHAVALATTDGVLRWRGGSADAAPPWERLTVEEAFRRFAGVALDDVLPDEDRFFRLLVEKIEPELGQGRPTFLTEYPIQLASLARPLPHDPTKADRFEAYVAGVELCNGFGELTDPVEQRRRLEADQAARREAGLAEYPIDERFLAALEEGVPPCAGNALGVDRLVLLCAGGSSLSEVRAFGDSAL